MKLCIRAHDLGAVGTEQILDQLERLGADSAQLVCYKVMPEIAYVPGSISRQQAADIGAAFAARGKQISLVGAYFNPVHPDEEKVRHGMDVFADYLRCCNALGCCVVGSETGSFNGDRWIYHPQNRTEEGLQATVAVFSQLREIAQDCGSTVGMEGAAGHVCWNVQILDKARKMVGGNTKVIIDLANFLDKDNQGEYLTILRQAIDTFGDDILMFHLKDCLLQNGEQPRIVPYGTGDLDIAAVLGMIKKDLPNATLTLEETASPYLPAAVKTVRQTWEQV